MAKKKEAGQKIDAYEKRQMMNTLEKNKISFEGNIYTMTALAFYRQKKEKLKLTAIFNSQRVYMLMLMFFVQNGLLLFMTLEIVDLQYTWMRDYWFVVYLARFICCIALHLKLTPNITKGLALMNFANNHPDEFTNDRIPVIAGFMQVVTAIFGETINLCMLLGHREVERCIIHFITLAIVLEMA